MNNESKIKKLIKNSVYIIIIILIITVIGLLILKYNVEGEKNIPFKLSSIIVISNAEGYQEQENKDYMWNVNVFQYNDVYINIEKNKNYKETEIIKSIVIDNIKILETPKVGQITFFRPSGNDSQTYEYTQEYEIKDSIEYAGSTYSDIKNLQISNQGSSIFFRILNKTNKAYLSNEETLEHSGKLLTKVGITKEEIKMQVSLDLTINLESDISFKTNIKLELPIDDISAQGSSNEEIKDTNKFVFKRK